MASADRSRHPFFDAPFVAMAHRGGALLAANVGRENTLRAFTNAVELGYRYLETDVHVTADGVLIAFHDEDLDRVTDSTGAIADLPWAQVRQARVGGSEPIPRLDDLLEAFPDQRFNIDIKAPGAVDPLVAAIQSHGAQDRVCVGSFDGARLRRFRRLAGSGVATSSTTRGVVWTRFVPFVPRLLSATGLALQIPVDHVLAGRRVRLVTSGLIATAQAAGRQVHVWTVDDPVQMHELIDLGVDGLISDRIDVLRSVCVERGLWR